MAFEETYDVAVIGAGPAGASAARWAATSGLKTVVFDRQVLPRFKACGGALSPRNIPLLGKHGLAAVHNDVDELRLYSPSFQSFVYRDVVGHFVIRRDFDMALVKDAVDAGAVLKDNCRVSALRQEPGGAVTIDTEAGVVRANYVVVATGNAYQEFLRELGAPRPQQAERDYMAACVVSETPIDNRVLQQTGFDRHSLAIFFGAVPNGYGWVFVKKGYLNIGIGATAILLKDVGAMRAYHQFLDNLREHRVLPPDLRLEPGVGCPLPFKHTAKRSVYGHVLLAGDAAGFVSPVSGEGLYYSLKGGQLAAEAIVRHRDRGVALTSYEETWRREFGDDLDNYGYFLREQVYKNTRRMETVVSLGRKDPRLAQILNKMLYGIYNYRQTMWRSLLRLPISLLKAISKRS